MSRNKFINCDSGDLYRIVLTTNKISVYTGESFTASWTYLKICEEADEYIFMELNHNCVRDKKFLYISSIGIKTFLTKREPLISSIGLSTLEKLNELPTEYSQ